MMLPAHPRIIPDRDRYRKYYLDEDVTVYLENGDILQINKGFRFDAHSVPFVFRLWFKRNNSKDIYAALVHDYLVDTSPWHRYNRRFIDREYTRFMRMPTYKDTDWRSSIMPKAVRLYGFLRFDLWGDNRGKLKPGQKVEVRVVV